MEYNEKIIIDTIKEQKARNLDYKEYSTEEYIDKAEQKFTKVDRNFIKESEKYKTVGKYNFIGMKKEIKLLKKVFLKNYKYLLIILI